MSTHRLKTIQPFFDDVGVTKFFEARRDDRNFAVGDRLELIEWDGQRPGRTKHARIVYKLTGEQYGIMSGFCILGIEVQP